MNTTLPFAALDLLRSVALDISSMKAFRLRDYRARIANLEVRPDAIEDARQAGIQTGLDLAATILAERIKTCTSPDDQVPTKEQEAQLALTIAQAQLKLVEPGAKSPIASAAYSAYAQAFRNVQLARKAVASARLAAKPEIHSLRANAAQT